ncbi:MAG: ATP-dependent DNA helicase RecG [Bacteroidetes bacterium]|nr:ATP-dependent DNA helicase RecG [Bacteroidota bacterium]
MDLTYSSDIQFAPGIGPERAKALRQAGIETVADLLGTYPRRYLDRSAICKIRNLRHQTGVVTLMGTVTRADLIKNKNRGQRFSVMLDDGTGVVELIFFQGINYLKSVFSIGGSFAVSGKPDVFGSRFSLVHPDYDALKDDQDELQLLNTGGIIPLYPSGDLLKRMGLDSRGFRRTILKVMDRLNWATVSDPLDEKWRAMAEVPDRASALQWIHRPQSPEHLQLATRRLKLDDILSFSLAMELRKLQTETSDRGLAFSAPDQYTRQFYQGLPFKLTQGQIDVLRDIRNDLKKPHPMNRLLQGDVGSGKTVVAMMSMLMAVDNGYQAALMAPTEILAEQHYQTMTRYLKPLGLDVVLLTGGLKSAGRTTGTGMLQSGLAQLAVGTHALISEGVIFKNLGLIVVDEQHRFGVLQRAMLRAKGLMPHVLVMSATPIPRTLAMTVYGDLEVSRITELPSGRQPVKTVIIRDLDRPQLNRTIADQINRGRQVYFVYPLIEESEKSDLKAATDAHREISEWFPAYKVGLLHGRLPVQEKDEIMASFKANQIQILVSTTVIEVGVDVPNATVMIIEHADRFGLSQLHQLRGRVGRGAEASYCFLVISDKLTSEARERLTTMERTNNGFEIAEKDLEIRGAGDILGTRQSGLPDMKLLDLARDYPILQLSGQLARAILADDPHLRKPSHALLRSQIVTSHQALINLAEIA